MLYNTYNIINLLFVDQYPDGDEYLTEYDFENYKKSEIWRISGIFLLCNVVVFYFGLLNWQDVVSIFRCKKSTYNVADKYGNDCRKYVNITSNSGELQNDNSDGEALLSGVVVDSKSHSRSRIYMGMDEDSINRPRASSDISKKDLSLIRTGSSHTPKIFARETSVTSQTGFKTHSSYSRGFSSANSGSGLFYNVCMLK